MRILIVENVPPLREEFKYYLEQQFPYAQVLEAGDRDDTLTCLCMEKHRGHRIDVAILDFNLEGLHFELDLCDAVHQRFPGCLIFHFTAFVEHVEVRRHDEKQTKHCSGIFAKSAEGSKRLVDEIRHRWGQHLLEDAEAVFCGSRKSTRGGRGKSVIDTHEVNILLDEIAAFHDNFDDKALEDIERYVEFEQRRGDWAARPRQDCP